MTTTLTTTNIVIVAHLTRKQWATQLADTTGAEYATLDDGHLGCTGNHKAAWEWHTRNTPENQWAVVIEDDAMPIDDFRPQLDMALAAAPTDLVSLYLGRERPPQYQQRIATAITHAAEHDHPFITSDRLLGCVATCLRGQHIHHMLTYITRAGRHLDIDEAITQWARVHQHMISYTMPSLVDHRDGVSVAKHQDGAPRIPGSGRIAWRTGARTEWTGDTTAMPL